MNVRYRSIGWDLIKGVLEEKDLPRCIKPILSENLLQKRVILGDFSDFFTFLKTPLLGHKQWKYEFPSKNQAFASQWMYIRENTLLIPQMVIVGVFFCRKRWNFGLFLQKWATNDPSLQTEIDRNLIFLLKSSEILPTVYIWLV